MNALYNGLIVAAVLSAIAFYPVTHWLMGGIEGNHSTFALWLTALVGLAVTAAIVLITEYYTGTEYQTGAACRRSFHHRPRDQHHRRTRRFDEVDGRCR